MSNLRVVYIVNQSYLSSMTSIAEEALAKFKVVPDAVISINAKVFLEAMGDIFVVGRLE